MRRTSAWLTLGVVLHLVTPAHANEVARSDDKTIMFVCLHGAANSQIAAAYFNQLARERGLSFTAVSRGIEVTASIPTRIRDGLSLDGLEPVNDVPQPLTPAEAASVTKVVAFDAVPDEKRGVTEVNYWSDVPLATKDYAAARDVIVRHIDQLVPSLVETPRPRETLHGTVTGVDERNDRITLRAGTETGRDFKVQDGLVFDMVRSGDQVVVTVENVNGAETIVGVKKE